jgi:hypothetical protein
MRYVSSPLSVLRGLGAWLWLLMAASPISAQAQSEIKSTPSIIDTTLVRGRARTAIQAYEAAWLRAWVLSTANRHAIVGNGMTGSMRAVHELGAIVHTPYTGRPGFLYDTTVTKEAVPVSRAEVSRCPQPTTILPLGTDRITTVGEYTNANPAFGPRLAFKVGIPSRFTGFAVCPTWYLGPDSIAPWDERQSLDAALGSSERESARAARSNALGVLRALITSEPSDPLLWGQLVRLGVDQGESVSVLSEFARCSSIPAMRSWCELLRGYALHSRGEVQQAERAFRAGVQAWTASSAANGPTLHRSSSHRYSHNCTALPVLRAILSRRCTGG